MRMRHRATKRSCFRFTMSRSCVRFVSGKGSDKPITLTIEYSDQYITESQNHSWPTLIFTINNLSASSIPGYSNILVPYITYLPRTALTETTIYGLRPPSLPAQLVAYFHRYRVVEALLQSRRFLEPGAIDNRFASFTFYFFAGLPPMKSSESTREPTIPPAPPHSNQLRVISRLQTWDK